VVGHRRDGGTDPLPPQAWGESPTAISRSHLSSIAVSRTWAGRTRSLRGADVLLCLRPVRRGGRGAGEKDRLVVLPGTPRAVPDPLDDDTYAGTFLAPLWWRTTCLGFVFSSPIPLTRRTRPCAIRSRSSSRPTKLLCGGVVWVWGGCVVGVGGVLVVFFFFCCRFFFLSFICVFFFFC